MSFETATNTQAQRKNPLSTFAPFFRRQQTQAAATWMLLGIAASLFALVIGESVQPLTRIIGWGGVFGFAWVGVMTVYPWLSGDVYLSRVWRPAALLIVVAIPMASSLVHPHWGGLIGDWGGRIVLTILTVVMPLDWAYMLALSGMALVITSLVVLAQLPAVRLMAWCIGMWQAWMHEGQVEPSVTSARRRESAPVAPIAKAEPVQTALTAILANYGVSGAIEKEVIRGHVVDRHMMQLPIGTKTAALPLSDIARDMQVKAVSLDSNVGGGCIGLDVPAKVRKTVSLTNLLASPEWSKRNGSLPCCPAIDVYGNPVVFDIADLPHIIIAGTTGSGKSVFMNAMLLSLMASGEDFRLIIADGKGEDFAPHYARSSRLMQDMADDSGDIPAIATDSETIKRQVLWITAEMDNRFATGEKPYPIIFVTDELADIVMQDGKDKAITKAIARISQKARSAKISMMLATQYPVTKVIDPIIAVNTPSRAGLLVDKDHQSRVVIGENGCENLLGKGDCLLKLAGKGITRVHGAMITDTDFKQFMQ